MDRLAWLYAQPWISKYSGCGGVGASGGAASSIGIDESCDECRSGRCSACASVSWFFCGVASFFGGDYKMEHSSVSPDAAYMYFAARDNDPSQMALRMGNVKQTVQPSSINLNGARVLLIFDDCPPFVLDAHQIQNVVMWNRNNGCRLCRDSDASQKKECSCQRLPDFLTIQFRHVAVNIYGGQDNEAAPTSESCSISELSDHVVNVFKASKDLSGLDDPVTGSLDAQASIEDLLTASRTEMQQYVIDLESICDSAITAAEICNADTGRMARLLLSLAENVCRMGNRKGQIESLKKSLHIHLQECQEEEQVLITQKKTTNAVSLSTVQLAQAKDKISHITEALLELDIITA